MNDLDSRPRFTTTSAPTGRDTRFLSVTPLLSRPVLGHPGARSAGGTG